MHSKTLEFLSHGLLAVNWWQLLIIFAVATQITIFAVTIYLHRYQAHRALDLNPVVCHFFRFWLWLTTGMQTKDWVAVHRKHHAKCETIDDPHSPQIYGLKDVLLRGVELYTIERKKHETLEKYGHGTPEDWIERNVYSALPLTGAGILLVIDLALFGVFGLTVWALQIAWIPFFAAGLINGAGHALGYRNFATEDTSTNLTPIAFFIGGEELHNNHHAFPSSARFSMTWWELDIGWQVIKVLRVFRLARVRRVAPKLKTDLIKTQVDLDTLRAIFAHRFKVMSNYYKQVMIPVMKDEAVRARISARRLLRQGRQLMRKNLRFMDENSRAKLDTLLTEKPLLRTVYEYRQRLSTIWNRSSTNPEELLRKLQEWCKEAEATGIKALQDFAESLRGYALQPAI